MGPGPRLPSPPALPTSPGRETESIALPMMSVNPSLPDQKAWLEHLEAA